MDLCDPWLLRCCGACGRESPRPSLTRVMCTSTTSPCPWESSMTSSLTWGLGWATVPKMWWAMATWVSGGAGKGAGPSVLRVRGLNWGLWKRSVLQDLCVWISLLSDYFPYNDGRLLASEPQNWSSAFSCCVLSISMCILFSWTISLVDVLRHLWQITTFLSKVINPTGNQFFVNH